MSTDIAQGLLQRHRVKGPLYSTELFLSLNDNRSKAG